DHPAPSPGLDTLPLHAALPIFLGEVEHLSALLLEVGPHREVGPGHGAAEGVDAGAVDAGEAVEGAGGGVEALVGRAEVPRVEVRSEEHTSELQSRENLVCRVLR